MDRLRDCLTLLNGRASAEDDANRMSRSANRHQQMPDLSISQVAAIARDARPATSEWPLRPTGKGERQDAARGGPRWSGRNARLAGLHHHEAEARRGDRAGLAGHGPGEALALQGSRHVRPAGSKQAREEFHDTSPCKRVTRGAFARGVGHLGDEAHIGAIGPIVSGKSEAAERECDIGGKPPGPKQP